MNTSSDTSGLGLTLVLMPFVLTAIPIIIAAGRRVLNVWPTVIVSVLLSWTFVGFFIALLVAVTSRTQSQLDAQAQAIARAMGAQR